MDNIAHGLLGLFLAIIVADLLRFKEKKWPIIIGVIAAELPDIDFVIRAFGSGFYLVHHREFSHSVIGVILLSLILTYFIARKMGDSRKYFLIAIVGTASHIFLDVITSFGTQVLYPFSHTRFAFSLVSIVDIYVWLIFGLGALALWRYQQHWLRIASITLGVFLIFLIFKSSLNLYADTTIAKINNYNDVRVYPTFLNPFFWKAVVVEPAYYLETDFNVLNGGAKEFHRYSLISGPEIEASKKALLVQQFLEFSELPYAEVQGSTVSWKDLRFHQHGRSGFIAVVELDGQLNVKSQKLGF